MARKKKELSADKKLAQLTELQDTHTEIDQIQILKGELPMEVADLEDEIEGMNTRLKKIQNEIKEAEASISDRKNQIETAQALITKYDKQLNTVKNNREFDALSKEIEIQKLDSQIHEKRIRETSHTIEAYNNKLDELKSKIDAQTVNLEAKKNELKKIVVENEEKEAKLTEKAQKLEETIEPKLLKAYKKIRSSYRNGLAVVNVERDACGGCFGKIPPQTQAEIKLKKTITTCEHCGRILVDVLDIDTEGFISALAMKNE